MAKKTVESLEKELAKTLDALVAKDMELRDAQRRLAEVGDQLGRLLDLIAEKDRRRKVKAGRG
jgi:hypothetical protein